jgi:hypothetical protein
MRVHLPYGVRAAIERLPPYPSLLVLAVPLAVVEPLKLGALLILGDGHLMTGTAAIVCAYAVSLFVTERVFVVVKPKLLELSWFAILWKWFVAARGFVLDRMHLAWSLRRKPLWMWDDAQ